MRRELIGIGLGFSLVSCVLPVMAQSQGRSLEERLAALERRVEQLERENADLHQQISRALPEEDEPRLARQQEGPATPPTELAAFPVTALPAAAPKATSTARLPPEPVMPPAAQQASAEREHSDRLSSAARFASV